MQQLQMERSVALLLGNIMEFCFCVFLMLELFLIEWQHFRCNQQRMTLINCFKHTFIGDGLCFIALLIFHQICGYCAINYFFILCLFEH